MTFYKGKYNNNHGSQYYSLAQQFRPRRQSHSKSINLNLNSTHSSFNQQHEFTFNNNFNPNHHLVSAHTQKKYIAKYRSSSLPSSCMVKNVRNEDFSYYDQLKRRDYITGNNCYSHVKNKNPSYHFPEYKSKYSSYNSMNDLNKFYKNSANNKIMKNKNEPILRTNVKVYEKYDKNNRFTKINTQFSNQYQSHQNVKRKEEINNRENQMPMVDCNIEVKSDDQGRFFSTVESHFPAILTDQKTNFDLKQQVYTTHLTFLRDYSHSVDNFPLIKLTKDKDQNPQQKTIVEMKNQFNQKVNNQYLPQSNLNLIQKSNTNKKNQLKKVTKTKSKKYIYSKYFIAEMQSKKQQNKKDKSQRSKSNSDRSDKTKGSLSKRNQHIKTTKKVTNMHSPKNKKNNQKINRLCHQNYVSSHLFTVKK